MKIDSAVLVVHFVTAVRAPGPPGPSKLETVHVTRVSKVRPVVMTLHARSLVSHCDPQRMGVDGATSDPGVCLL